MPAPLSVVRAAWIAAAALILACGGRPSDAGEGSTATDDFGIPLPRRGDARRIVSLSPATTEMFFALGAGARLVGRTHWDAWPPEASTVDDLGPGMAPNVEVVLATRPDLVLLYAAEDNRPAAKSLASAGIATVALRLDRIRDVDRALRVLGALVGDSVRARVLADSVTAELQAVRNATTGLPRPTVFLHAWDSPLIAIGAGSFLSELVSIAGGENIYNDLSAPSGAVAFEDVVRRNPYYILAGAETLAQMRMSERWRLVRAVREGRLLESDTLLFARPSVQLGAAARAMARLLHPGAVP